MSDRSWLGGRLRNALLVLLRVCGYIYHLALCLFLLGLGVMWPVSGQNNLKLAMLPWEGVTLTRAVTILGVVGIVCVLLAITGWRGGLFPLWALSIFGRMFRGFFLSSI